VPTLSSRKNILKLIVESIDFQGRKKFCDLGSGNGRLILSVAKFYPDFVCTGIEYNLAAHYLAKLANTFAEQKASFIRDDFFKVNLGNEDVIYAYLFPTVIKQLEEKLAQEVKEGAIVIINTFPLKKKKPDSIIRGKTGALETLYIYKY